MFLLLLFMCFVFVRCVCVWIPIFSFPNSHTKALLPLPSPAHYIALLYIKQHHDFVILSQFVLTSFVVVGVLVANTQLESRSSLMLLRYVNTRTLDTLTHTGERDKRE